MFGMLSPAGSPQRYGKYEGQYDDVLSNLSSPHGSPARPMRASYVPPPYIFPPPPSRMLASPGASFGLPSLGAGIGSGLFGGESGSVSGMSVSGMSGAGGGAGGGAGAYSFPHEWLQPEPQRVRYYPGDGRVRVKELPGIFTQGPEYPELRWDATRSLAGGLGQCKPVIVRATRFVSLDYTVGVAANELCEKDYIIRESSVGFSGCPPSRSHYSLIHFIPIMQRRAMVSSTFLWPTLPSRPCQWTTASTRWRRW